MDYKKLKKSLKKTLRAVEQMEMMEMFIKAQAHLSGKVDFASGLPSAFLMPDFKALNDLLSQEKLLTASLPDASGKPGATGEMQPPPMTQEEWLRSLLSRTESAAPLGGNLSSPPVNGKNGSYSVPLSATLGGGTPQSDSRLQSILDATPLGLCITNEHGIFEYVNPAYTKIYGYTPDELLGKHFSIVVPNADVKFWQDLHDQYIAGAEEVRGEWKVVHKSGRELTILADAARITGTDNRPKKVTFVMDVTEYSRRNQDLQSLTRAVESAYNAILITDAQQNIIYVNEAFEKFTGYSFAEAKGKNPRILQGIDTDKTTTLRIREKLANHEPVSETLLNYTKDGRPYWININIRPVFNEKHEFTGFIGVEEDVTERITQTQELSTLKRAIESAYNAILITDAQQNIIYVNEAFEKFTGYSFAEAKGKNPRILQGIDTDKTTTLRIREKLANHEPVSETLLNYTKDGRPYWININIRPVFNERGEVQAFIGVEEDVTEKLRLEGDVQQSQLLLMQAEKMSSLGQMVAGLAHEMNTPLGFVRNNLEMLESKNTEVKELLSLYENLRGQIMYGSPNDVAFIMSQIDSLSQKVKAGRVYQESEQLYRNSIEGIDRIQDLVLNLKNFSRLDESTFKSVDINASMESTLKIAGHVLKNQVEVIKLYGAVPAVLGYPAQLNQVFLNLITNAAQAIESKRIANGRITIHTALENGVVKVRVSDNGGGISPENLKKIFDPFFTTKDVGKGTGLGLSIVFKIVEKHRGKISVESEFGKGTEFTVELPTSGDAAVLPEHLATVAASPFAD